MKAKDWVQPAQLSLSSTPVNKLCHALTWRTMHLQKKMVHIGMESFLESLLQWKKPGTNLWPFMQEKWKVRGRVNTYPFVCMYVTKHWEPKLETKKLLYISGKWDCGTRFLSLYLFMTLPLNHVNYLKMINKCQHLGFLLFRKFLMWGPWNCTSKFCTCAFFWRHVLGLSSHFWKGAWLKNFQGPLLQN